jgi:hypothetical protein
MVMSGRVAGYEDGGELCASASAHHTMTARKWLLKWLVKCVYGRGNEKQGICKRRGSQQPMQRRELVSWSLVLLEERGVTDIITAAFS